MAVRPHEAFLSTPLPHHNILWSSRQVSKSQGLSQPVNALSLEYTPECIESTLACVDHLAKLGEIQLNFSMAESMELSLPRWIDRDELSDFLTGLGSASDVWGDVYVRFVGR